MVGFLRMGHITILADRLQVTHVVWIVNALLHVYMYTYEASTKTTIKAIRYTHKLEYHLHKKQGSSCSPSPSLPPKVKVIHPVLIRWERTLSTNVQEITLDLSMKVLRNLTQNVDFRACKSQKSSNATEYPRVK